MEFRVELLVRPLGFVQELLRPGDLQLVLLLHVTLQRLEIVPLAVEIHQLSATLVDLFLKSQRRVKIKDPVPQQFLPNLLVSCNVFSMQENDVKNWTRIANYVLYLNRLRKIITYDSE